MGNQPPVTVAGERIEGILISARGSWIDGQGSILGESGPTALRPQTYIPAKASMTFDTADLREMEHENTLTDVITHEMGHALGIGSVWEQLRLLVGKGGPNPRFKGSNAIREFHTLLAAAAPGTTLVPVENTGGEGTADSHWRESVFGNELMTGFIGTNHNPLSRMTIASLEDLGYTVNYDAAEEYNLPSALQLAMIGVGADKPHRLQCSCATMRRNVEPIVLDERALL